MNERKVGQYSDRNTRRMRNDHHGFGRSP
jgi:hypothetical protein